MKSKAEILQTLDEDGRLNGLSYIPAMSEFSGKRFRVFKRMETMYQEESGNVRRLRNTVLLDGCVAIVLVSFIGVRRGCAELMAQSLI